MLFIWRMKNKSVWLQKTVFINCIKEMNNVRMNHWIKLRRRWQYTNNCFFKLVTSPKHCLLSGRLQRTPEAPPFRNPLDHCRCLQGWIDWSPLHILKTLNVNFERHSEGSINIKPGLFIDHLPLHEKDSCRAYTKLMIYREWCSDY